MVKIYTPCYEITFWEKFNRNIPPTQRNLGGGAISIATLLMIITVCSSNDQKGFHIALTFLACFLYLLGVLILTSQFEEKQSLSAFFKFQSFSAEESAPDDDHHQIILDVPRPMEDYHPSRKAYETPHISEHDVESNSKLSSLRTVKNCSSNDHGRTSSNPKIWTQVSKSLLKFCSNSGFVSTRRS
ncbi:predicted protein [Chaetoceros tenuissimus]|uniref:Uncharacterized protein n=1 Tax=Chaetoceros tenuissimus TaxID=426638 RepID=A0AAD3D358_9STRA|nr:predicted protein [Chaetoceros tenuissimus]